MIERKTQRIINNRCPIIQLLPPNLKCFANENERREILWIYTFSNKIEFALNPACLETLNEEINDFTYLSPSYLSSRLLFGLIAIVLLSSMYAQYYNYRVVHYWHIFRPTYLRGRWSTMGNHRKKKIAGSF